MFIKKSIISVIFTLAIMISINSVYAADFSIADWSIADEITNTIDTVRKTGSIGTNLSFFKLPDTSYVMYSSNDSTNGKLYDYTYDSKTTEMVITSANFLFEPCLNHLHSDVATPRVIIRKGATYTNIIPFSAGTSKVFKFKLSSHSSDPVFSDIKIVLFWYIAGRTEVKVHTAYTPFSDMLAKDLIKATNMIRLNKALAASKILYSEIDKVLFDNPLRDSNFDLSSASPKTLRGYGNGFGVVLFSNTLNTFKDASPRLNSQLLTVAKPAQTATLESKFRTVWNNTGFKNVAVLNDTLKFYNNSTYQLFNWTFREVIFTPTLPLILSPISVKDSVVFEGETIDVNVDYDSSVYTSPSFSWSNTNGKTSLTMQNKNPVKVKGLSFGVDTLKLDFNTGGFGIKNATPKTSVVTLGTITDQVVKTGSTNQVIVPINIPDTTLVKEIDFNPKLINVNPSIANISLTTVNVGPVQKYALNISGIGSGTFNPSVAVDYINPSGFVTSKTITFKVTVIDPTIITGDLVLFVGDTGNPAVYYDPVLHPTFAWSKVVADTFTSLTPPFNNKSVSIGAIKVGITKLQATVNTIIGNFVKSVDVTALDINDFEDIKMQTNYIPGNTDSTSIKVPFSIPSGSTLKPVHFKLTATSSDNTSVIVTPVKIGNDYYLNLKAKKITPGAPVIITVKASYDNIVNAIIGGSPINVVKTTNITRTFNVTVVGSLGGYPLPYSHPIGSVDGYTYDKYIGFLNNSININDVFIGAGLNGFTSSDIKYEVILGTVDQTGNTINLKQVGSGSLYFDLSSPTKGDHTTVIPIYTMDVEKPKPPFLAETFTKDISLEIYGVTSVMEKSRCSIQILNKNLTPFSSDHLTITPKFNDDTDNIDITFVANKLGFTEIFNVVVRLNYLNVNGLTSYQDVPVKIVVQDLTKVD